MDVGGAGWQVNPSNLLFGLARSGNVEVCVRDPCIVSLFK